MSGTALVKEQVPSQWTDQKPRVMRECAIQAGFLVTEIAGASPDSCHGSYASEDLRGCRRRCRQDFIRLGQGISA
jgi:hypothetical protein